MYEGFYQLHTDPFRLSPDYRFCFAHHSYAKAKAYVEYGLHRAEGLVAVTGSPGTGKSTLVEDLLTGLESSRIVIARLVTTQLEATDLLRMLAFEFKLPAEEMAKATLLRNMQSYLAAQAAAGRRVIIIIDEAQDLSSDALEELRLLTNLQICGRPLVQILLLGQDQLHKKITSPSLEQLRQRLVAVSRLKPMTAEETHAYISHRLTQAGWAGDPEITANAVELIYQHSRGVPRLVNQTCSRLLLHGSIELKHMLDGGDARVVIEELVEEAPPLRDEGSPTVIEATASVPTVHLSDIKLSSSESAAQRRDQTAQRNGASNDVARSDPSEIMADIAENQTRDNSTAVETKTYQNSGIDDLQPTTKSFKAVRSKGLIAIVVILIVVGVVGAAALESKPFGPGFARWSRDLAANIQDKFMASRMEPFEQHKDIKSDSSRAERTAR